MSGAWLDYDEDFEERAMDEWIAYWDSLTREEQAAERREMDEYEGTGA